MKKLFAYVIICLSFLMVGCDNDTPSINSDDRDEIIVDFSDESSTSSGLLKVSLPSKVSSSNSRSLSNSIAASLADTYAIFILGENGAMYNVDSCDYDGDLPFVQLGIGTYKILVLAGQGHNAIGFGYDDNVVIVAETITNVPITLSAPDVSITVSDEPYYASGSISMSFYANVDVPFVWINGGSYSLKGDNYIDNDAGYNRPGGASRISVTRSIALPLTPGEYILNAEGFSLSVFDEDLNIPYTGLSSGSMGYSWSLYKLNDMPGNADVEAYNAMFTHKLTVETMPTGADIEITWEED